MTAQHGVAPSPPSYSGTPGHGAGATRYHACTGGATISFVRVRTAFLALLAAVALAAGLASSLAAITTGSGRPAAAPQRLPIPLTQLEAAPSTRTNLLADEVDALGRARYGAVYGGSWTGSTGRAHFGLVEAATASRVAAFVAAVRQFGAELKERYVLVPVSHSFRSLAALTLRLRETTAMRSAGVLLVQWGPDPRANAVVVHVKGSEQVAERSLRRRFGAGWFVVRRWKGGLPVAGPADVPVTAPDG